MLRVRPPRLNLGPALRQAPFPLGTVTLSALIHLVLVGLIVVAGQWATDPEKAYVVNLVPAVPAVGTPQGTPTVKPPPPRVEEPPRREEPPPPKAEEPPTPAPKAPPVEQPQREAVREMPARPSAAREMPPRDITPRVPLRLREPMLPPQTPALPRPEQKELPNIASPSPTRALPPPAPTPTTPAPTRQAAAPPLGQPGGSRQGAGAITLDVTDFPHAWYMREVQQKVSQKWDGRARDGQQPVAVFQIGRDGRVTALAIEKTSGNSVYDLAALRAITEASPFPPLPEDFRGPWLRVHLGFGYAGTPG
jgi:TonB family protein